MENKTLEQHIEEIMWDSKISTFTVFDRCTVVACELPNGFVIVESFLCENPDDYNEEFGETICLDKIANDIWELENYKLNYQDKNKKSLKSLFKKDAKINSKSTSISKNKDYEECEKYKNCYEFNEYLDTKLDCDDCDNYDCPHSTRT